MTGDLLDRLLSMRIEEPGAARSFEEALADEEGWPRVRAEKVALEYRRFLYLAATSGREVTPSVLVDKAWHLHLTYSRHYWETLCGEMLSRPLHHRPSLGGAFESERHRRQYEDTLALYQATFGTPPPPSVWPRRSRPSHGQQAAKRKGLRRFTWLGSGLLAAIGFWGGVPAFLAALLLIVIVTLGAAAARNARADGRKGDSGGACGGGGGVETAAWTGDGGGDGAGCGGGCGGCGGCGG